MTRQTPTVGRIVHFYESDTAVHLQNGTRVHPAMITRVWSDTCVNLQVFFDCGPVETRSSVCLNECPADTHNPNSYWEWPSIAKPETTHA